MTPSEGGAEAEKPTEALPPPVLEHTEKGSFRSMWELLMQLRVLLPYLTRLVPLLDRGLLKATPDFSDIRNGIDEIRAGSRSLGTQVRNHSLQLERMEEQLLRQREMGDQSRKDISELLATMHSLETWIRVLAISAGIVLVLVIAVLVLELVHPVH